MAVEIKIPSMGESIHEGTIARWLKQDGDQVERDETLFELETDKATSEFPSPAAGTLRIGKREGETVTTGTSVGQIEDGRPAEKKKAPEKKPAPKANSRELKPEKPRQEQEPRPERETHERATPGAALPPSVRRLVREHDLDLNEIEGTGPGGRITADDVRRHVEAEADVKSDEDAEPSGDGQPSLTRQAGAPTRSVSEGRRQPMTAIRKRIAERLVASQKTTATLTTFNEADLSAVLDWRARHREGFKKKHGVDLGLMPFFVKVVVQALRDFPILNASIDGGDIVFHEEYHIGIAVSAEKGLMVPVLHHADRLSFADTEKRIRELAEKARAGKIAVQDLQGGTFTITNGGVFGSLLSTPILNPPQSGILGMHTIQKRPVVMDDQIVVRPMMYLALSYDHRLIDGAEAVKFLVRVKECLEDPGRLLLET